MNIKPLKAESTTKYLIAAFKAISSLIIVLKSFSSCEISLSFPHSVTHIITAASFHYIKSFSYTNELILAMKMRTERRSCDLLTCCKIQSCHLILYLVS